MDDGALSVFQERVRSVFGSLVEVLLAEITEIYRQTLTVNTCDGCVLYNSHNSEGERGVSGGPQPLMSLQGSDITSTLQSSPSGSERLESLLKQSATPKNLSPDTTQVTLTVSTSREQTEKQLAAVEDEEKQATVTVDDAEILTFLENEKMPVRKPEEERCRSGGTLDVDEQDTLGVTESDPAADVKHENTDEAVTEDDVTVLMLKDYHEEQEIMHLEETQACKTLAENTEPENPGGSEEHLKPEENGTGISESEELVQNCSFASHQDVACQGYSRGACFGTGSMENQDLLSTPSVTPELRRCIIPCSVQLQRTLKIQRPTSHSGRFHVCSYCPKIFIHKKTLRRHRRFHTGERPHSCSLCPKTFILRKTLRKHKKDHFRKPYSCTQCEKRFKNLRKLRRHWRFHDGEGPFVCNLCGKLCKTLKRLDHHLSFIEHK